MTPLLLLLAAAAGQLLDRPLPDPPHIGVWDVRPHRGGCAARLALADGIQLTVGRHRARDDSSIGARTPAWTDIEAGVRYPLAVNFRPGGESVSGRAAGGRVRTPDRNDGSLNLHRPGSAVVRRMAAATEIEFVVEGRPLGRFAIPGAAAAMAELQRCAEDVHRSRGSTPAGVADFFRVSDYPAAAVRAGEEGIVGFRLVIDADGRVAECLVTSPSGSAALDETTCRILRERVRYRPATGADAPIATEDGGVTWLQPR